MGWYLFFTLKNTIFYFVPGAWNPVLEQNDPVSIYKVVGGVATLVVNINELLGFDNVDNLYTYNVYVGKEVVYIAANTWVGEISTFGLIKFTV